MKVRKRAKIRNRYNQAPHLTQDTKGKVTTPQLDITNESQRSALSQQVTTRHQQTDVPKSITKPDRNNINVPQKKYRLGTVSKNILLEGFNRFNGAPTSPLVQKWIKTHRCLVCMKDPKLIKASSPRRLTHQYLIFLQYLSQLQRPISYNQSPIIYNQRPILYFLHCGPNTIKTYPSIFNLPTISLRVAEANIIQPEANILQPEANIIQPEANIIQYEANIIQPEANIIFLALWLQWYEDLPINF